MVKKQAAEKTMTAFTKPKLWLILLLAFAAGLVVSGVVFSLLYKQEQIEGEIVTPKPELVTKPDSAVEEEEVSTMPIEPLMRIYQNTTRGFQIKYPESFYADEGLSGSIVGFVKPPYLHSIDNVSIFSTKKESVSELYERVLAQQQAEQAAREEECRSLWGILVEDFDACVGYGGGYTYEVSTFAENEALIAEFRGEGEPHTQIVVPLKGIQINYLDPRPAWLDTFEFIDQRRLIRDPTTRYSFICPAFWACTAEGATYKSYANGFGSVYSLRGPDGQFGEMFLFSADKETTRERLEAYQRQLEIKKQEIETLVEECKKGLTETECRDRITTSSFVPYATYEVGLEDQDVFISLLRAGNLADEAILFFINGGGIFGIEAHGFQLDLETIRSFFE